MPIRSALCCLALAVDLSWSAAPRSTTRGPATTPSDHAAASLEHPGRPDPTLTFLFTPRGLPKGVYQAFVAAESVDAIAARYRARFGGRRGAWAVIWAPPVEIFGVAAPYDRAKVARLYGGRRARVARGSIKEGQRVAQSVTLISPHPDASLTQLLPGTLILVFNIPEELTRQ